MKISFAAVTALMALMILPMASPGIAQNTQDKPQVLPARPDPSGPQIQPPRPSKPQPPKPQPPRPPKPQPPRPPRPPQPPRPPIVVRDSIILYSHTSFRGESIRLTGSASSLGMFNFNNRAVSVRVTGRWQVCDRTRYHGTCRTISGSSSNLARIGLSERISSVRYLGR